MGIIKYLKAHALTKNEKRALKKRLQEKKRIHKAEIAAVDKGLKALAKRAAKRKGRR